MEANNLLSLASMAAIEKKAEKIVVQDLLGLSDICRVQMICSGSNERQVKAISDGIQDKIKKASGVFPLAVEGLESAQWVVIDYGHTLIHVFKSEIRHYYGLESLWPSAPTKVITESSKSVS